MSRRQFKPADAHRKTVQAMAGYGIKAISICQVIINPETGKPIGEQCLRRHFRAELDNGEIIANSKVAESLYTKALGSGNGSVTAAIFWLKTRAGWKETQNINFGGHDGGPLFTKDDVTDATAALLGSAVRSAAQGGAGQADSETDGQAADSAALVLGMVGAAESTGAD